MGGHEAVTCDSAVINSVVRPIHDIHTCKQTNSICTRVFNQAWLGIDSSALLNANKAHTRLALNAIAISDKHGCFDMPAFMTFQYCIDV